MPELAGARGLPGEQCLWSGGPARARISLSDFGLSVYLLAALVLMAILAPSFFRHLPALFIAAVAVVWGGIVLQSVGQLIYLLVLRPRIRRGQSYIVTDRRVLVTTGLHGHCTWPAYLDQIDEPAVGPQRDDIADIRFQNRKQTTPRAFLAGELFPVSNQPEIPVLHDVAAENVQQVAAQARRRMLARETGAPLPDAPARRLPVPDGVTLQHAERTLWTGRAGKVPMWFGPDDLYISAFGLLWLTVVSLICAMTAASGDAWALVFFIPSVSPAVCTPRSAVSSTAGCGSGGQRTC